MERLRTLSSSIIFKCEILKDERYMLLSILYDNNGESFKRKPYEKQLHELFTLGFNDNILTVHIGKGILTCIGNEKN